MCFKQDSLKTGGETVQKLRVVETEVTSSAVDV